MEFKRLLDTYDTKHDKCHTHISTIPYKKSFYVESLHMDELFDVYSRVLLEGRHPLGLMERFAPAFPVLVDIDLKRPTSGESNLIRLYTQEDVRAVQQMYVDVFRDVLPDLDESHFLCVVLEKQPYFDEAGAIKNGFHLHFPKLFLSRDDHENHIVPSVVHRVNEYFSRVHGFDSAFDQSILRIPWLMYGSRKAPAHDPYFATYALEAGGERKSVEEALDGYEVFDGEEECIRVTAEQVQEYLPRILSTIPLGRPIQQIAVQPMRSERVRQITQQRNRQPRDQEALPLSDAEYRGNLVTATKLLDMLADYRASERNHWLQVGWVIFNACGPGRESLQLWIDFSARAPDKFSQNECIRQWGDMHRSTLSIRSLYMMASKDDPAKFGAFQYTQQKERLLGVSGGAHYDLAMLLYADYGRFHKCTSFQNRAWYVFEDHIWRHSENGIDLRSKISTELCSRFDSIAQDILTQVMQCQESMKKVHQARYSEVQRLIKTLKTSSSKDNIMRECSEIFYDRMFHEKLDSNPGLFGFNNGVYDVNNGCIRPGNPEDYLSKKTHIDYAEFTDACLEVDQVNQFLLEIFPDTSIRRYFLDTTCKVFMGGNGDKKVFVWTGDGDNGKSVTQTVMEKMLGPYSIKLPTSLLTGKRQQSSAPCPELARTGNGIRWAVLQEPDRRDDINVGILKELSGNDTFFARDLYQKGSDMREITPMFKVALVCNEPPTITQGDKATWERIRIVPFESCFVNASELPETWEEQLLEKKFAKNPKFYDKIPGMVQAFAWMLLEHYKTVKDLPYTEPAKVTAATEEYRARNDIFRKFALATLQACQGYTLNGETIYQDFKQWYREKNLPPNNFPERDEFAAKMSRQFEILPDGTWKNVRYIPTEGSSENDVAF